MRFKAADTVIYAVKMMKNNDERNSKCSPNPINEIL